ncbi:hypothetical protein [Streptomyces sp. NPDC056244]|uniref:hypothetical protein n=1 Tax=Streptomyces sp. NPDC056244 TaxID=3345762 RepID=UPI0035D797A8
MPSALRAEQDAALARAVAPQVNAEWAAYCAARREAATLTAQIEAATVRTDEDCLQARRAGICNPQLIVDACEDDIDDAIDL